MVGSSALSRRRTKLALAPVLCGAAAEVQEGSGAPEAELGRGFVKNARPKAERTKLEEGEAIVCALVMAGAHAPGIA